MVGTSTVGIGDPVGATGEGEGGPDADVGSDVSTGDCVGNFGTIGFRVGENVAVIILLVGAGLTLDDDGIVGPFVTARRQHRDNGF
jgi:hypothetical protein